MYGHDHNSTFTSTEKCHLKLAINLTVYFTLPSIYKLIIQGNIKDMSNQFPLKFRSMWVQKSMIFIWKWKYWHFFSCSIYFLWVTQKKIYFHWREKPSKIFPFQSKIQFHSPRILSNAYAFWSSSSSRILDSSSLYKHFWSQNQAWWFLVCTGCSIKLENISNTAEKRNRPLRTESCSLILLGLSLLL